MDEPLIETWNIHNRINLYFLVAIPDEVFALPSTPIHRLVFQLLAHIHNRHESHSRRRIAWTLKDLGLWEWGVR